MKCYKCKIKMEKRKGVFKRDNVEYEYHRCKKCGEELLDMGQLHDAAEQYRELRDAKKVKFSKWGNSLAVRISNHISKDLKLKEGSEGWLIKDGKNIKIEII